MLRRNLYFVQRASVSNVVGRGRRVDADNEYILISGMLITGVVYSANELSLVLRVYISSLSRSGANNPCMANLSRNVLSIHVGELP